jgi:hypothetical protein
MVTQQEAESLAQKLIQDYLNACKLDTTQDAGNALMKLCSVAGVMMVATVGYQEAVDRMKSTASFIAVTMHGVKFKQERAN